MTKKQNFIAMVEHLIQYPIEKTEDFNYEDAVIYFESLKASKEKEKVAFTDNGKKILVYMQEQKDNSNNLFKSKEIAEGLFVSSRSISGAMRKLVEDGYVEKIGESPASYSLTENGMTVSFTD